MSDSDTMPYTRNAGQKSQIYYIGELSRAIHNDELMLHYQPRYHSNTGELATLEALVRWQHPERGLLLPDAFLPLAREVGLISALGFWVLEQCCKDFLWLSDQLNEEVKVTINVSPSQCNDALMAQSMLDICDRYVIEPCRFEFEIARCDMTFNKNNVMQFCEKIAEAGASYNIIDSGQGYTSLDALCDFNVNLIKMRTSFIDKIHSSARKEIVIRRLIELAHELKLKVIAVGIEHPDQRDLLTRMECDMIQGYLMSRPTELENISRNILHA